MIDITLSHFKTALLFPSNVANELVTPLTAIDIERIIPHRDPFLLVDGVEKINLASARIQASRKIATDDPVFLGHFPGNAIYPGVLQQESLFQTALILLYFLIHDTVIPPTEERLIHAVGTRIYDVFHQAVVRPGDVMTMQCCITEYDPLIATAIGQIIVNQQIVTLAKGEFYVN